MFLLVKTTLIRKPIINGSYLPGFEPILGDFFKKQRIK